MNIKECLIQICKTSGKYAQLLECLEQDEDANGGICVEQFGDAIIKELFSKIQSDINHQNLDLAVCAMLGHELKKDTTTNSFEKEEIIKGYLCDYIKQWTEMEVTKKDENNNIIDSIKITVPYKIGKNILDINLNEFRPKETDREKYDFQIYSGDESAKPHPETIRKFLDAHKFEETEFNKKDIENFLSSNNIGVDCSGFVCRILASLMESLEFSFNLQTKTLGKYGEKLKNDATSLRICSEIASNDKKEIFSHSLFRFEVESKVNSDKRTYTGKIKNFVSFINSLIKEDYENSYIKYLKPGDVIFFQTDLMDNSTPFHIAIIYKIEIDKNKFWTADSTSYNRYNKVGINEYASLKDFAKRKLTNNVYEHIIFARPKALFDYYNDSNESYLEYNTDNKNQFDFVTEKDIKYAIEVGAGNIVKKEEKENGKKYIEDLSPVCTGVINPTTHQDLARLIAIFNCGASSNRVFNYIHYYSPKDPFLTIGFIHSSKPPTILIDLIKETKIVDYIVSKLPEYKVLAEKDTYLTSIANGKIDFQDKDKLKIIVTEFLKKIGSKTSQEKPAGYANDWAKNIYENKEKDWFQPIMRDALLLKDVCIVQTKRWIENNPLGDAKKKAKEYHLDNHYGLVATLASIRSSSLGNNGVMKALQVAISNQIWSKYKNQSTNNRIAWLEDKKNKSTIIEKADNIALEVFLWYNRNGGSGRSRQEAIYKEWFAQTWGHYDSKKIEFHEYQNTKISMEKLPQGEEVFKYY